MIDSIKKNIERLFRMGAFSFTDNSKGFVVDIAYWGDWIDKIDFKGHVVMNTINNEPFRTLTHSSMKKLENGIDDLNYEYNEFNFESEIRVRLSSEIITIYVQRK